MLQQQYTAVGVPAMWRAAREIAAHFGKHGGVIALRGDLGAGKTTLMQGVAAALGVTRPVTSPTFALALEYPLPDGRRLVHMDLYRLPEGEDLNSLGFDEYLGSGAIIAIEWAERAADLLPPDTLWIDIRIPEDNPGSRILSLTPPLKPCLKLNLKLSS